MHHHRQYSCYCACSRSKISHRPDGKNLDALASTRTCRGYVPQMQTHCPDGKIADVLASTLTCTTAANTPINYSWYVPQRPEISPSPRWDFHMFLFCAWLAGRRCVHQQFTVHQQWHHGELLILHHHGQHSSLCACSRSKVPIAPMGTLLTSLPRLTLAQLRPTLRSTTGCTCCRDLAKFPSPSWEIHVLLVVCRAAVSMSLLAQSRQRLPQSTGTQPPTAVAVASSSIQAQSHSSDPK